MNTPSEHVQILAESPYLNLVQRGHWAYATRPNASGVVVIVPVTNDGNLIFVEQYRPPVNSRVLEFPAGLAGDIQGAEDEALEQAARRELLEETGYEAKQMTAVFSGPVSPGITDETITLFIARDLQKTGAGGGDDSEDITLHEIPAARANGWLVEQMAAGCQVACPLWVGLHFLQNEDAFRG